MTVKATPVKISRLQKDFVDTRTGKRYTFSFYKDDDDPNPASYETFADEELVRQQYWYNQINENDIVFDIGASFGSYTLPALAEGAMVYSFCPEHELPLLKRSIVSNNFTKFNVLNFGLYSETGIFKTDTMEFAKTMSQGELNRQNEHHAYGWYIHVKTLDDFVNTLDLDKLNIMKIDAEGAELHILKGGEQTIKKHRPKILVEFHIFKDINIEKKCHEFLLSLGYDREGYHEYTTFVHHGLYVFQS